MSRAIPLAAQAALSKFESARETLNSYSQRNAKIIRDYDMLRQAHNEALKHMKSVYKEHYNLIGESFGDFRAQPRRELDVDKLMMLLGTAADAVTKVDYKIDREAYNTAVKSGLIPASVVQAVEIEAQPAIYGPKEV